MKMGLREFDEFWKMKKIEIRVKKKTTKSTATPETMNSKTIRVVGLRSDDLNHSPDQVESGKENFAKRRRHRRRKDTLGNRTSLFR